jgi:hypothetical protein
MTARSRTYTGVFYPGEAYGLEPLIEQMKFIMLPGIISPVHLADDKEKSAHVHFMVDYPNAVRLETVKQDYGAVAANGYLEPVRSRKVMMRYFLHLDDEDKEQLDQEKVITLCGAIFDVTPELTADDIQRLLIEIEEYCEEASVLEYSDLCRLARVSGKYDWYRIVTTHTIHYAAYFRSLRNKGQK